VTIETPDDPTQGDISGLLQKFTDAEADGILVEIEKPPYRVQWAAAQAEKPDLEAKAAAAVVSATAYDAAYVALTTVASDWTSTGTTDVSGRIPSIATRWSTYFSERVKLQNALTAHAQDSANAAKQAFLDAEDDYQITDLEKSSLRQWLASLRYQWQLAYDNAAARGSDVTNTGGGVGQLRNEVWKLSYAYFAGVLYATTGSYDGYGSIGLGAASAGTWLLNSAVPGDPHNKNVWDAFLNGMTNAVLNAQQMAATAPATTGRAGAIKGGGTGGYTIAADGTLNIPASLGSTATWGSISGSILAQADLQAALSSKLSSVSSATISDATSVGRSLLTAATAAAALMALGALGTTAQAYDSARLGGVPAASYVQTTDSRLSDARLASDVYSWAKAATKPAYSFGEIGPGPILATTIKTTQYNLALDAGDPTGGVFLGYNKGNAGTFFGNGAGSVMASISGTGALTATSVTVNNGPITANDTYLKFTTASVNTLARNFSLGQTDAYGQVNLRISNASGGDPTGAGTSIFAASLVAFSVPGNLNAGGDVSSGNTVSAPWHKVTGGAALTNYWTGVNTTLWLQSGTTHDFGILNPPQSAWIMLVPKGTSDVVFGGSVTTETLKVNGATTFIGPIHTQGGIDGHVTTTGVTNTSTGKQTLTLEPGGDLSIGDGSGIVKGRNSSDVVTWSITAAGDATFHTMAVTGYAGVPGSIGAASDNGLMLRGYAGSNEFTVVDPGNTTVRFAISSSGASFNGNSVAMGTLSATTGAFSANNASDTAVVALKNQATSGIVTRTRLDLHAFNGSSVATGATIGLTGNSWGYSGNALANQLHVLSYGSGGTAFHINNSGNYKWFSSANGDEGTWALGMTLTAGGALTTTAGISATTATINGTLNVTGNQIYRPDAGDIYIGYSTASNLHLGQTATVTAAGTISASGGNFSSDLLTSARLGWNYSQNAIRTLWGGSYGGAVQIMSDAATVNRWSRIGMTDGAGNWLGGMTIANDLYATFSAGISATHGTFLDASNYPVSFATAGGQPGYLMSNGGGIGLTNANPYGSGSLVWMPSGNSGFHFISGGTSVAFISNTGQATFNGNVSAPAYTIADKRSTNPAPNAYPDFAMTTQFNQALGEPTSDWTSTITMRGWTGDYAAWQLSGPASVTAPNRFFLRSGAAATWQPWVEIYHSGNINSTLAAKVALIGLAGVPVCCTLAQKNAGTVTPAMIGANKYLFVVDDPAFDGVASNGTLYMSNGSSWGAAQQGKFNMGLVSAGSISSGALATNVALVNQVISSAVFTSGGAGVSAWGVPGSGTGVVRGWAIYASAQPTVCHNGWLGSDHSGWTYPNVMAEFQTGISLGGYDLSICAIGRLINGGIWTRTTPGTYYWTCPPNITKCEITLLGGGGSGSSLPGAGGGGGGGSIRKLVDVTPGTIYTIVVGSGGASVTNANYGNNGTASTGMGLTAYPGQGGQTFNGGVGGNGGSQAGGAANGGSTVPIAGFMTLLSSGGAGGGNSSNYGGSCGEMGAMGQNSGGSSSYGSGGLNNGAFASDAGYGPGAGGGGNTNSKASGAGREGFAMLRY
jgi:hypothetical protein